MLTACWSAKGENTGYVRLHVIAASDSRADQTLKLKVRDAVLACARELLAEAGDADTAWDIVNHGLDALEAAAKACAREAGYNGPVRCVAGVFAFPPRQYGDTRLPAGQYRALRVVIGPGAGHNWWCVLYPDLCYPEGVDPEHPEFYSVIWRWLTGLFGGGEA